MEEDTIRKTIAANIINNRKRIGITQAELAERISYSDKSVSKWERGDGMPDIPTMIHLSEIFGVSVNDLVYSPVKRAENPAEPPVSTDSRSSFKHYSIIGLAIIGVWAAAFTTICLFTYISPSIAEVWNRRVLCFALTAAFIVFLVLGSMWLPKSSVFIACSGIIWSSALAVFVTFSNIRSAGIVFLPAAVLQAADIVCFIWQKLASKNK